MRHFLAPAVIAGLATALPLVVLAVYVLLTDTGFNESGDIDNAPMQAAGLVLFVVAPALAIPSIVFFYLVGLASRQHSFSYIGLSAIILCFSFCFVFAIRWFLSPSASWEAAKSSVMLAPMIFVPLMVGGTVWWRMVRPVLPPNNSLKGMARTGRGSS